MALVEWRTSFNTGIDVIDGQHRQLVEMINRLHQASSEQIRDVLLDLIDYTESHYAFEETLMEDAGYPFCKAHKRVHESFIKRVAGYKRRFDEGENIAEELTGVLSRWLVHHIKNDDAAYAADVKANLNRLTHDRSSEGWLARSLHRFFGHR